MLSLKRHLLVYVFSLLWLMSNFSCRRQQAGTEVSYEEIGKIFNQATDSINADNAEVYIDISGSMANFVTNSDTPYKTLFTKLEAALPAKFGEKNVKLFTFGDQIQASDLQLLKFAEPRYQNSIYGAAATRLDLVFDKISRSGRKTLSFVITDAETEGRGEARRESLIGEAVSSLAAVLDNDLSIRMIGIRSQWAGTISRPFYVFLVGDFNEVKNPNLLNQIGAMRSESLMLSKRLLKADSVKFEFLDDQSNNVELMNDGKSMYFELNPKRSHRMTVALRVHFNMMQSYLSLHREFKLSSYPNLTKSISRDEEDRLQTVDKDDVIQIVNVRGDKEGENSLLLSFDIEPFQKAGATYVTQFTLHASENDVDLNLPAWIGQWSSNDKTDFSKTYLFKESIEPLIRLSLLRKNPFQLAEFYLIL